MLPDIYILTMGRTDKQLTYNMLPQFLKDRVIFVIRDFEEDFFKTIYPNKIAVCPEWVCNVATTRKFIQQIAGDSYHWVMDDDVTHFYYRPFIPESSKPWAKFESTIERWQQFCDEVYALIQDGMSLVTLTSTAKIPSLHRYPVKEGLCGVQWFMMNGHKCSTIEWDAVNLGDDYDACMQLIFTGHRVCRMEKWVYHTAPFNAAGGCHDDRTVERHNAACRKLVKRWHPYIVEMDAVQNRKNVSNQSKYGINRIRLKIFFVKAYKDHAHMRSVVESSK